MSLVDLVSRIRICLTRPSSRWAPQAVIKTRRRFCGRTFRLAVRGCGDDVDYLHQVMRRHDALLQLPCTVEPRVIVDVGAGVGIAALYFATVYPDAQVYCYELSSSCIELLRKNVQHRPSNVHVLADTFHGPQSMGLNHIDLLHINNAGSEQHVLSSIPDDIRNEIQAVFCPPGQVVRNILTSTHLICPPASRDSPHKLALAVRRDLLTTDPMLAAACRAA